MRKSFKHWFWGRILVIIVSPIEIIMQTLIGTWRGFCEGLINVRDGLRR